MVRLLANKIGTFNRHREDIYLDILSVINRLQYTEVDYVIKHTRTVATINENRNRDEAHHLKPVKGALLRNVQEECKMNYKMCKYYLRELYMYGLIDLGIYLNNTNYEDMNDDTTIDNTECDKLITLTDKGYKMLRILKNMREMIDVKTQVEVVM